MAYTPKAKTPTEHPFRTIVKLLDSEALPRVLVCFGHEEFLVNWAEKYVKRKLVEPAAEALDCTVFSEDLDPYSILAACETLPMLSKRKLVVVHDTDLFTQTPKDMKAEGVQILSDYLANVPETTLLLFTAEKVNKTKALYKNAVKAGVVYDFCPLDRMTLAGWIAKQLQALGKNASRDDILAYADRCGYLEKDSGYTLYNVKNDVAKAAAFADGQTVTAKDFAACMQGEEETDAFAILDAAFSGQKGKALTILHNSVDAEQASKQDGVVLRFLGLLCSQLEIMLEARERGGRDGDPYSVASAMGANPYRIKKAMEASYRKKYSELKASLAAAYDIEKDFKSGQIDAYLALELFIAGL
ncbi:MAG: DNA polymerase III subunit delta [Firmicutes bacterium]|nr:DNA polymerase III subunit delta [Bacillota bacterium]